RLTSKLHTRCTNVFGLEPSEEIARTCGGGITACRLAGLFFVLRRSRYHSPLSIYPLAGVVGEFTKEEIFHVIDGSRAKRSPITRMLPRATRALKPMAIRMASR